MALFRSSFWAAPKIMWVVLRVRVRSPPGRAQAQAKGSILLQADMGVGGGERRIPTEYKKAR